MKELLNQIQHARNLAFTALPVYAVFFLITAITYFFHPEEAALLHEHWVSAGDISQGYLLILASCFLVAISVKENDYSNLNPHYLILVVGALAAFTVGKLVFIKLLSLPSLVILWYALCGAIYGHKVTRKIRLSAFIALMAMPAWYMVQPILQTLTVFFVSSIFDSLDLTTYIYKNYIEVPTGTIHVAGGCSGTKYFTSAISLALIASALNHRNTRSAAISILIAGALAILANWIRVLILVLYAYYKGVDTPLMADHDNLGWVIFAVVMAPWLYFDKLIPTHQNTKHYTALHLSDFKFSFWKSATLLVSLCLPFVWVGIVYNSESTSKNYNEPNLQELLPALSQINPQTEKLFVVSGYDKAKVLTDLATCDSRKIGIYSYYQQSQDKEMVSGLNSIWDRDMWEVQSDSPISATETMPEMRKVELISSSGTQSDFYYWYQIGKHASNTAWKGKLWHLINRLTKNRASRIFILSSTGSAHCRMSEKELEATVIQLRSAYKSF